MPSVTFGFVNLGTSRGWKATTSDKYTTVRQSGRYGKRAGNGEIPR